MKIRWIIAVGGLALFLAGCRTPRAPAATAGIEQKVRKVEGDLHAISTAVSQFGLDGNRLELEVQRVRSNQRMLGVVLGLIFGMAFIAWGSPSPKGRAAWICYALGALLILSAVLWGFL